MGEKNRLLNDKINTDYRAANPVVYVGQSMYLSKSLKQNAMIDQNQHPCGRVYETNCIARELRPVGIRCKKWGTKTKSSEFAVDTCHLADCCGTPKDILALRVRVCRWVSFNAGQFAISAPKRKQIEHTHTHLFLERKGVYHGT